MITKIIRLVLTIVGGEFLGVIVDEKLPDDIKCILYYHNIIPLILISIIVMLSLEREEITYRNIATLFAISIILAIIAYYTFDYLEEIRKNPLRQKAINDKSTWNPSEETMTSLKLERALNQLPWFSPTRPAPLKL